jgi:hypothetical protein
VLVAGLLTACTGAATGSATSAPQRSVPSTDSPASTASAATPRSPTAGTATPVAATVALDGPPEGLAGIDTAATVIERPLRRADTGAVVVTRGGPRAIGPLRSASAADAVVAAMWGADLVTTVATGGVVARQRAAGLAVVEEATGAQAVLRDPARRAPHNAYAVAPAARSAAARAVATRPAVRSTPWTAGAAPAAGGRAIDRVHVDAAASTTVTWTWDTRSGTWRRIVDGDRQLAAGATPVAAGTVVVAETAAGRPGELRGAGVAVVLRAGRRYAARWRGGDTTADALRVEQRDSTPFPAEGTVWVHLCAAPCARQIAPSP